MKVFLAGHEGTKKILPASSWLVNKYIPKDFDVYWLNFGEYTGKLFRGKFISMDDKQFGGINAWSSYIRNELELIDDKYIIFGLDDYLLNKELDTSLWFILLRNMKDNVVCGRLCDSTFYKNKIIKDSLIIVGDNEYTCTAQWCVWDRIALLDILYNVTTPWEFEIKGTELMKEFGYKTIGTLPHALDYPDTGSLSRKWEGIKINKNNEEDIKWLKENGIL